MYLWRPSKGAQRAAEKSAGERKTTKTRSTLKVETLPPKPVYDRASVFLQQRGSTMPAYAAFSVIVCPT